MKKIKKQIMMEETGITLVEVIASIALLSVIMLLFFMIFSQFLNTSNKSEDIISATYVAQTEMEQLYQLSKTVSISEVEDKLLENGYINIGMIDEWIVFEKYEQYDIRIKLKLLDEETNLEPVVIEVYDPSTSKLETKMESLFTWKE